VPGLTLQTDAHVLLKRPPGDAFQGFVVFSAEHGPLHVLQRLPGKKSAAGRTPLDLFDEVALQLESSNQGQTWFVKEVQLRHRPAGIGRSYETLRHASDFAALIARNRVPEEGRAKVGALLAKVFAAFAGSTRPDLVHFKALYSFARDEGYPVGQQWLPTLPATLRRLADDILHRPLTELEADGIDVVQTGLLHRRLEEYLRGHTEVLLD